MRNNPGKIILAREYPSSLESRKVILSSLMAAIVSNKIVMMLSHDELKLVFDEAITNAMEHGNHWDSNKKIHVELRHDKEFLHLRVRDEGVGFNYLQPQSEYISGNKLSKRGRGISLIRRFCSPVWEDAGRIIDLPIRIGK